MKGTTVLIARSALFAGMTEPDRGGERDYLVTTGGDPSPARLGTVRERLPAFSMSADEFVDHVLANLGDRPANHERIVAINLGRAAPRAGEAFELELGPSNCAVGAAGADAD